MHACNNFLNDNRALSTNKNRPSGREIIERIKERNKYAINDSHTGRYPNNPCYQL